MKFSCFGKVFSKKPNQIPDAYIKPIQEDRMVPVPSVPQLPDPIIAESETAISVEAESRSISCIPSLSSITSNGSESVILRPKSPKSEFETSQKEAQKISSSELSLTPVFSTSVFATPRINPIPRHVDASSQTDQQLEDPSPKVIILLPVSAPSGESPPPPPADLLTRPVNWRNQIDQSIKVGPSDVLPPIKPPSSISPPPPPPPVLTPPQAWPRSHSRCKSEPVRDASSTSSINRRSNVTTNGERTTSLMLEQIQNFNKNKLKNTASGDNRSHPKSPISDIHSELQNSLKRVLEERRNRMASISDDESLGKDKNKERKGN